MNERKIITYVLVKVSGEVKDVNYEHIIVNMMNELEFQSQGEFV